MRVFIAAFFLFFSVLSAESIHVYGYTECEGRAPTFLPQEYNLNHIQNEVMKGVSLNLIRPAAYIFPQCKVGSLNFVKTEIKKSHWRAQYAYNDTYSERWGGYTTSLVPDPNGYKYTDRRQAEVPGKRSLVKLRVPKGVDVKDLNGLALYLDTEEPLEWAVKTACGDVKQDWRYTDINKPYRNAKRDGFQPDSPILTKVFLENEKLTMAKIVSTCSASDPNSYSYCAEQIIANSPKPPRIVFSFEKPFYTSDPFAEQETSLGKITDGICDGNGCRDSDGQVISTCLNFINNTSTHSVSKLSNYKFGDLVLSNILHVSDKAVLILNSNKYKLVPGQSASNLESLTHPGEDVTLSPALAPNDHPENPISVSGLNQSLPDHMNQQLLSH